jgi:hypothetical protein
MTQSTEPVLVTSIRLLGNNLVDQMARGIDSSLCVIVCVTKQYVDKVGGLNGADNCKKEFTYAEQVNHAITFPHTDSSHLC